MQKPCVFSRIVIGGFTVLRLGVSRQPSCAYLAGYEAVILVYVKGGLSHPEKPPFTY